MSTLYGMYDLFASAGRDWSMVVDGVVGDPLLAPRIVSRTRERFEAGNGVRIEAHETLDECGVPDVVCIADLMVEPGADIAERYASEIAWLRRCAAEGAHFATACSGAMLLAEAGLLDGCDVAIHWGYGEAMARRYPNLRVHTQRALSITGPGQRYLLAGGGTSWLDLSVFVIARLAGTEAAMRVARMYLIDWHALGQQPYAALARKGQVDDALVSRAQVWIAQNYNVDAPVQAMAAQVGLAERSFKRRFARATGMSPLEYVHTLRLEEAKHLLETTVLPVDAVAAEVGYQDASFFGRLFRRRVELTPAKYRKRFASMRQALTPTAAVA
ncbi:MAG TPA: helix-turn-helix domain-containing protein [Xanthomonadales bacterium]|nr:helix-turn-helix domain-containing protein [Xanthomonadales bacterium]